MNRLSGVGSVEEVSVQFVMATYSKRLVAFYFII